MKISREWLKDYVQIDEPVEKLAARLTMAGLETVRISEFAGDTVLEIEVTTNRPDCLCLLGIAREAAALTGKKLKIPGSLTPQRTQVMLRQPTPPPTKASQTASLKVEDSKGCRRYVGWLIGDVKVEASPDWMRRRLEAGGIRPVNNVVDITNYCMLETGQPAHAFDFDRIAGGKIIVRRAARKGEEIVTIDGGRRALDEEMLVIADAKAPVALAGIMGGKETEISPSTRTIFLECAHFDPALIRRTAQRLGISSESSYRFERDVNLENILAASCRAADLIIQITGGRVLTRPFDTGQRRFPSRVLILRLDRLARILGVNLTSARVRKILTALDFEVKLYGSDRLQVAVPSFRRDVTREIDLIEEVARHFGYDQVPAIVSSGRSFAGGTASKQFSSLVLKASSGKEKEAQKLTGRRKLEVEKTVRRSLTAGGLSEVITYGMISRELLAKAGFSDEKAVAVVNPLSAEQAILRTTQIPGMLRVVLHNLNQKNRDLKIFELGRVFQKSRPGVIQENNCLSLCLTGKRLGNWQMAPDKCRPEVLKVDFFDLKGAIEVLLAGLGIGNFSLAPAELPLFEPGRAAALTVGKKTAGGFGEVKREILDRFDVAGELFAGEFNLDDLIATADLERKYRPVARFPKVVRDVAVVVDRAVESEKITMLIRQTGVSLVSAVKLFDYYCGKQVPPGKKSLAYSIEYQAPDRTLTEPEVDGLHQQIRQKLAEELHAEFR